MRDVYDYVASDADFAELCTRARQSAVVYLDTEFVREKTYFPIPALLQFNVEGRISLLDPLAISGFAPLQSLLADDAVVKVMHSCSEDLEVFSRLAGTLPANLFDTQIAAAICGEGFSLGYQKLVEQLLGEQLEKTETRSKWLQRPLTAKQCHYAVDDVRWLPDIYSKLQAKLAALGREQWCAEDCARLVAQAQRGIPDQQQYLRLRGAAKLSPDSLGRLQALCAWREAQARASDVPKGHIATDATLLDIAERAPGNSRELAGASKIRQSTVRRYGEEMLECIANAGPLYRGEAASKLAFDVNAQRQRRDLLRKLQARVREVAHEINLPVEVLGRKRDLETLIDSPAESVISSGWREPLLAEALQPILESNA